jgi:dUTP pyrophosphatase
MVDFSGLRVKRLDPAAALPKRYCPTDAGYDLASISTQTVFAGHRRLFKIGFATEMPYGIFGQISDRSGLAFKHGLTILGGVIDNGYRGEWGVILYNTGKEAVTVEAGDRLAQVVFKRYETLSVSWVDSLSGSDRGDGAYGSSG